MRAPVTILGLSLLIASVFALGALAVGDGRSPSTQAAVQAPPSGGTGGVAGGIGLPDLEIQFFSEIATGETCDPVEFIRVHFINNGDAAAGPFSVDFNGDTQPVSGLGAGATGIVSFPHNSPPGLLATVDVFDEVIESDESNNTLSKPPFATHTPVATCTPTFTPTPDPGTLPDLVVSDIDFGPTGDFCNPTYAVAVTISNIGGGDADAFFLLDLNGTTHLFSGLNAGTSYTSYFPGSFGFLTATVDSTNTIPESNESNNVLTAPPFPTPSPIPTCTSTPTPTATNTPSPTPTGTIVGDPDGDGISGGADNCPWEYNPGQLNSDRNFIAVSPPLTQNDLTRAMSDPTGDACDPDDDNDGLDDGDESLGTLCGGITTDPLLADTDGDGALDSAECLIGTDPLDGTFNRPSISQCAAAAEAGSSTVDTDGDRLSDASEFCGYNTDPTLRDSDGDGVNDGCEGGSLNHDGILNSGDQLQLAYAIIAFSQGQYNPNADLDKNGGISSGDQLMMARLMIPLGQCPSGGGPDLYIYAMEIVLETGGGCHFGSPVLGVSVTIHNKGTAPAGPFTLTVNGVDFNFPGLDPAFLAAHWFAGYNNPGPETAFVDSTSQVDEWLETNNQVSQVLPIPTLPPMCTPTPTMGLSSPTFTLTAHTPTQSPTSTPTP